MSNLFTTTTSATGMPTVDNISHNIPGSPRSGSPTILSSAKLRQVGYSVIMLNNKHSYFVVSTLNQMGVFYKLFVIFLATMDVIHHI